MRNTTQRGVPASRRRGAMTADDFFDLLAETQVSIEGAVARLSDEQKRAALGMMPEGWERDPEDIRSVAATLLRHALHPYLRDVRRSVTPEGALRAPEAPEAGTRAPATTGPRPLAA